MSAMSEAEKFFMAEVELALIPLIKCINQNYDPKLSRDDLDISWAVSHHALNFKLLMP